jgi:hypothetical protein
MYGEKQLSKILSHCPFKLLALQIVKIGTSNRTAVSNFFNQKIRKVRNRFDIMRTYAYCISTVNVT